MTDPRRDFLKLSGFAAIASSIGLPSKIMAPASSAPDVNCPARRQITPFGGRRVAPGAGGQAPTPTIRREDHTQ
jgi:hypothetical protein